MSLPCASATDEQQTLSGKMLVDKAAGNKSCGMQRLVFVIGNAEVGEFGLKVVEVAMLIAARNFGGLQQRTSAVRASGIGSGSCGARHLLPPASIRCRHRAGGCRFGIRFHLLSFLSLSFYQGVMIASPAQVGRFRKLRNELCKSADRLWIVLEKRFLALGSKLFSH